MREITDWYRQQGIIKPSIEASCESNIDGGVKKMRAQPKRNDRCPCGSGRKFKNCCIKKEMFLHDGDIYSNPSKMDAIGMEGDRLEKLGRYDDAEILFSQIVRNAQNPKFASQAITRMGGIEIGKNRQKYFLKCYDQKQNTVQLKVEAYYRQALELWPENIFARCYIVYHYFITGQFERAIGELQICSDDESQTMLTTSVNEVLCDSAHNLLSADEMKRNGSFNKMLMFLEQVTLLLSDKIEEKTELKYRFAELLMMSEQDNLLKAYDILSELKKEWKAGEVVVLPKMAELCNEGYLNRPKEGETYALQAVEAIEKALNNAGRDLRNYFIQLKFNTETVLASLYIVQEKSEQAMNILERHLQQAPNNTDIHNYARALFQLKRFTESVEYCQRALFLAEDESTLFLLAENYYCMKDYDLAAMRYRETLSFLERDNKTLFYVDANDKPLISWQKDTWHEDWYRKIFERLVPSYCIVQDFVSAKVFRDMALDKYSDLQSLQMWGPMIDKMVDSKNMNTELTEKYLYVCNQFELEKKMAVERTNKMRRWAQSLMQSQKNNFCKTLDLDNEENWENFAQAVDSIIENMKNENGNNSQQYDEILRQTQKKYPRLERTSTDFLATAEYLYSVHKGIRMDFAPIMVEYCKVVEYELKKILEIFTANRMELRFVDMIELVRRNNINKLGNIAYKLDRIRHLRNGSAHSGLSTEKKVLEVRQLLFDDEIINKICSGKA